MRVIVQIGGSIGMLGACVPIGLGGSWVRGYTGRHWGYVAYPLGGILLLFGAACLVATEDAAFLFSSDPEPPPWPPWLPVVIGAILTLGGMAWGMWQPRYVQWVRQRSRDSGEFVAHFWRLGNGWPWVWTRWLPSALMAIGGLAVVIRPLV
jgi:hypothetical protein